MAREGLTTLGEPHAVSRLRRNDRSAASTVSRQRHFIATHWATYPHLAAFRDGSQLRGSALPRAAIAVFVTAVSEPA